jgi:hypothetical protein
MECKIQTRSYGVQIRIRPYGVGNPDQSLGFRVQIHTRSNGVQNSNQVLWSANPNQVLWGADPSGFGVEGSSSSQVLWGANPSQVLQTHDSTGPKHGVGAWFSTDCSTTRICSVTRICMMYHSYKQRGSGCD